MTSSEEPTKLKIYKAMIRKLNSNKPGWRVTVLAASLEEARDKLESKHGHGTVFDLHNEDDAVRPRQASKKPVMYELVEDALRELADEETQVRLWQASDGAEVSSLIECTSRLWDDSGLATAMDREVVCSSRVDKELRQLRSLLHRIDASAPVDVILANPHLPDTRVRARALLEELAILRHDRASPS
jgi:hypothetical protein